MTDQLTYNDGGIHFDGAASRLTCYQLSSESSNVTRVYAFYKSAELKVKRAVSFLVFFRFSSRTNSHSLTN